MTTFVYDRPVQDNLLWYECRNVGRVAIPAHGVVVVDAPKGAALVGGRVQLRVRQPEHPGYTARVMVNGPTEIRPNGTGSVTDGRVVTVAYDSTDGVPQDGESWGPVGGSSLVRRHVQGGRVLTVLEPDRLIVVLRYYAAHQWAELVDDLEPEGLVQARLKRWRAGTGALETIDDSEDRAITADIREQTGEIETIPAGTLVLYDWDEQAGVHALRGWVC